MECTFVVSVSDRSKPLLTSSIPNLQFHILIIRLDGLEPEINSDSSHVIFIELVIGESQKQTGFSDWGIPYDHILQEMVILTASIGHLSNYYFFDFVTDIFVYV